MTSVGNECRGYTVFAIINLIVENPRTRKKVFRNKKKEVETINITIV